MQRYDIPSGSAASSAGLFAFFPGFHSLSYGPESAALPHLHHPQQQPLSSTMPTELPPPFPYPTGPFSSFHQPGSLGFHPAYQFSTAAGLPTAPTCTASHETPAAGAGTATTAFASFALATAHLREPMTDALSLAYNQTSFFQHMANEAALSHAPHHPLDYAYHLGFSRSILNFNHGFGPPMHGNPLSTATGSFGHMMGPASPFSPTEKQMQSRETRRGSDPHASVMTAKKERRERERKPVVTAPQKVSTTMRSASADSSWTNRRTSPGVMAVADAETPLNLATVAETRSPAARVKTEAVSPQPSTKQEPTSPTVTSPDSVFNTSAVVMILPRRKELVMEDSEDNPLLDLSQRNKPPVVEVTAHDVKHAPIKGEELDKSEKLASTEDETEDHEMVLDELSCSRTSGRLSERVILWRLQRQNQHRTIVKQEAAETQCSKSNLDEKEPFHLDCCRGVSTDFVHVKKEPLLSPGAPCIVTHEEDNLISNSTSTTSVASVTVIETMSSDSAEKADQQTKSHMDENANVRESSLNMDNNPVFPVSTQPILISTKLPPNTLSATKRTSSTANGASIPIGIAIARQRTEKNAIGPQGAGGGVSQAHKARPLVRSGPPPESNPALPSLFLQVPGGVVGKPLSNLGGNSWVVSGNETPFINSTPTSVWINPTQYNGANGEVNPPVVVPSLPLGYQLAPNPSRENIATSPLLLIPAACIDPFQRVIWPSYSTPQSWPFINSLQSSPVTQTGTVSSISAEPYPERLETAKKATVTPVPATPLTTFEEIRVVADAGIQTETPPLDTVYHAKAKAELEVPAAEDLDFSGLKLLSESVERLLPNPESHSLVPDNALTTSNSSKEGPQTVIPPVVSASATNTLNVLCALAEQRIREENMVSEPFQSTETQQEEEKEQKVKLHAGDGDVNCNYHVSKSQKHVKAFVEGLGSIVPASTSPSKSPLSAMEVHELDMRIQLAELQRRYREKQKELSRLTRKEREAHYSDSSLSCRSHHRRPAKTKKSQSLDAERSTVPPFSTAHKLLPLAKSSRISLDLNFPNTPQPFGNGAPLSSEDFVKFKPSYTAALVSASATAQAQNPAQQQSVTASPAKKRKPDLPKKHASSSPEFTETIVHKKPKNLYRILTHNSSDKSRVKPKLKAEAKWKKSLPSGAGDGIEHHFAVLNLTDAQPVPTSVPEVTTTKNSSKTKAGVKRTASKGPVREEKVPETPLETTGQSISCAIVPEELRDGLRVLIRLDDTLFHGGHVTAICPPDIYGIVVDGERASRPRIYSREEILQQAILEVRPSSAGHLTTGRRICAYWSQQSKCLYPGVIAPPSPASEPIAPSVGHRTVTEEFEVEFDDGDSGRIAMTDIRLLPPGHPVIQYDPNPLLTLERRRRRTSGYVETKNERAEMVSTLQEAPEQIVAAKKEVEEETVAEEPASKKCKLDDVKMEVGGETAAVEQHVTKEEKLVMKLDLHQAESHKSKHKHKKKHRHHRRHKKKHRAKEDESEESVWTLQPSSSPLPSPPPVLAEELKEEEEEQVTGEESEQEVKKRKKKDKNESKSKMAAFLPKRQLWRWLGTSFKKASKGKGRKEFYKAIHRGKEVIRVGDCAVFLSSGRPDRPYVGRIELLWQSWGGSMSVRVRWFYHPEETCGGRRLAAIKMPGPLFESPHVDENDVQTISHRCQVVPLPEFQRLTANMEHRDPTDGNSDLYYLAGFYDPTSGHLTLEPGVLDP